MRWGRSTIIGISVAASAVAFQGCGTVGALNNLLGNVIGTANNAAGKTLDAAGTTASKALTPNTYAELAKKAKQQPRTYYPSTTAPRTSARNHDAVNNSSNSTSGRGKNPGSYLSGKGGSKSKSSTGRKKTYFTVPKSQR
ncbi:MAG: hypothetical protein HUU46_18080 [Candidatus Hydrogenedentes bacterium]|nr:hypothetical protein [Candidatus Hydrogenedentota bacterium]